MAINKSSPISLLIVLLLSAATAAHSCHPIDKQALLHYKSKITYDPSNLLHSWNSTTDCCSAWAGVDCDSHSGRVISVTMSCMLEVNDYPIDTFMKGTLSPFLGNLSSLQNLHLNYCMYLTGPVPSELGKLTNLKSLYLHGNQLTGRIPASFKRLSKLKTLYLSENAMSGPLPSSLFPHFTHLANLSLSSNSFSGPVPASIGKMVSLTTLGLSQNHLSGSIPPQIGDLRNLNNLELSSNRLTGSIPSSIGKLRNLNVMLLGNNQISGLIPTSIGGLAKLRELGLEANKLTGPLPSSIGNLLKLENLFLDSNSIEGHLPSSIGNLASLNYLYISNNRLVGGIPPSFGKLINLKFFNLASNRLSGAGAVPAQLVDLQNLSSLDLSYNPLQLGSIPKWLSKASSLYELGLADTGLKGRLPSWLGTSGILTLDLSGNQLSGKIPTHTADWPASGFFGNAGLCGKPLPACK